MSLQFPHAEPPAPGTTMGVSDEVAVVIETEFSGPPLVQKPV